MGSARSRGSISPLALPFLLSRSFTFFIFPLAFWIVVSTGGKSRGTLAKATGLEMSSSMVSSAPQNREKGSKVSGGAPRWRYDSSGASEEEDDDCKGENVAECAGGCARACVAVGRKAKGGTPWVEEIRDAGK